MMKKSVLSFVATSLLFGSSAYATSCTTFENVANATSGYDYVLKDCSLNQTGTTLVYPIISGQPNGGALPTVIADVSTNGDDAQTIADNTTNLGNIGTAETQKALTRSACDSNTDASSTSRAVYLPQDGDTYCAYYDLDAEGEMLMIQATYNTNGEWTNGVATHITTNSVPTVTGLTTDVIITQETLSNIQMPSITFADSDGDAITVTLTASAGVFAEPVDGSGVGSGVTVTKTSNTTITLAGSADDINTYLRALGNIKYTPEAGIFGEDKATITISATDGNGNLASNPVVNLDIKMANVANEGWTQASKIVVDVRNGPDQFGKAVATYGDYAVVGAYKDADDYQNQDSLEETGSVYVFKKENGNWTQVQKISANDRSARDNFGRAVAMYGDYIVVGSVYADTDASDQNSVSDAGAVYIYKNNDGTWEFVQKIVASDRGSSDEFGTSVAIEGDTILVGAYGEDEDTTNQNTLSDAGSVYVYKNNNGTWQETQKLVASDRAEDGYFGYDISISGDNAIIGAYGDDEEVGSAYIFTNNSGTWQETQKIEASDRNDEVYYGASVAISGDFAIVGAYYDSYDDNNNYIEYSGSAYVYKNNNGTWQETQKLVPNDRDESDYFGFSIAMSGDYAIFGQPDEDEDADGIDRKTEAGSAYIFKVNSSGTWEQVQKIVANDRTASDYFGFSVAMSDTSAIVGANLDGDDANGNNNQANAGSAYIFTPPTAPTVTSTPTTTATVGTEYKYILQGSDENGDDLNWSVTSDTTLPNWLTLTSGGGGVSTLVDGENGINRMAVDSQGNVYYSFADQANMPPNNTPWIKKYNPTTKTVETILDKDDGLKWPMGVTIDANDNVYFSDLSDQSIKRYNISDGSVDTIVNSGIDGIDGFDFDSNGNIYFCDTGNQTLKKYDITAQSVSVVLQAPDIVNTFDNVIDSSGNIYFVDVGASKVKRLNASDNSIDEIIGSGLDSPMGLAMDNNGLVYVTNTGGYDIKVYDPSDDSVSTMTPLADTDMADKRVLDISFDSSNTMYLSTYVAGDSKIVKISQSTNISGTPTSSDVGRHDVNLTLNDGGLNTYHNFTIVVPGEVSITPTVSKGTTDTATKITYTPANGNSLKYMFSNTSVDTPSWGDSISNIISAVPYTSGTNLANAQSGQYLAVYEVDSEGYIVGFYQKQLASTDIYDASSDTGDTNTDNTTSTDVRLTKIINDQLVDINNTSSFSLDMSQHFSNATTYSYEEVKYDNNLANWLELSTSNGEFSVKSGFDNNSSLLGTYYIKVVGANSEDSEAMGYFTIRVKDINASLSDYINTTGLTVVQTDGTEDDKRYYETNSTISGKDISAKVYSDGSARHTIVGVAEAVSHLPDSTVKIETNGDVNTTTSTINENGDEINIEVIAKSNDTIKAIHQLTFGDGNVTQAISNIAGSLTVINSDRSVETNATSPSGATLSVKAMSDGKAQHSVVVGGKTSKATISVPNGITEITATGEINTKLKVTIADTLGCGGDYYADVFTDEYGNSVTKFKNDNENCYVSPTLSSTEEFPVGSESNVTQDSNGVIHINTKTPVLDNARVFNID
jgi:streptogramin lyase